MNKQALINQAECEAQYLKLRDKALKQRIKHERIQETIDMYAGSMTVMLRLHFDQIVALALSSPKAED